MGQSLRELVDAYQTTRIDTGLLLAPDQLDDCALSAARFYAAHGPVRALVAAGTDAVLPEHISMATVLTLGEWSLVRPLFVLYAEREQGAMLEASRASGIEFYGRSVAEIAADIKDTEDRMSERAFVRAIVTV